MYPYPEQSLLQILEVTNKRRFTLKRTTKLGQSGGSSTPSYSFTIKKEGKPERKKNTMVKSVSLSSNRNTYLINNSLP